MRKIIVTFAIFTFCLITAKSQTIDYEKYYAVRNTKIADHEIDPRVHFYDVGFYFLDLEMTNTSVFLSGNIRIDLNLLSEYNNELVFDFKDNMTVDSVKVNGLLTSYTHTNDLIVINYEHQTDFNEHYDVSVQIFYHGTPSDGIFYRINWYNVELYQFVYTLTEPYSAKYWFPCKQVVSDKADSSYFYVTIPSTLKAGSNGLLKAEYDIGGGKKRMEWQSSYPIAYYLISVSIGKYQDYSFEVNIPQYGTNILVQNYIPNNSQYLSQNSWAINRTGEMLQMLSEKLGLYPHALEKYGHCIVPLNGGMEHQTMTTLGNFDFRLVIHELTHSWFGDYVTCANWQDIWINEGFASYGEYLGEEFIQPEGYEDGWLEECQNLAKERSQGSVYVPFSELNSVSRIFDYRLTYRKGACLVHMIRYIINDDDLFFATLRQFLQTYGNSNATAEDLKQVLQNQTGINFDNFFNEWYYGEGYPIYQITWSQNENILYINLNQTTTSETTPLFTIPMDFKIIYDDNSIEIVRKEVTANLMNYQLPISKNVIEVIANPRSAILADVTVVQNSELFESVRNKVVVYPNPGSDIIYIILGNVNCNKIEILSSSGQVLKFIENYKNKLTINVDDLNSGIYFLKIYTDKEIINEKIFITK